MSAMLVSLSASDQRLLTVARQGLSLDETPFVALGRAAGLSPDAALARLRALAASGLIDGVMLVPASGAVLQARDAIEIELLDALTSGLPLVSRPYEALGALLGVPGAAVRARLAQWRDAGQLQCLAPTVHGQPV